MSRLNHSFSVEHAELYGIECAIMIHHFQFWIEQNKRLGKNLFEGKTWVYQTQKEIAAVYPYWNRDKVQAILKKLVDEDVLVKGNFNKSQFDKTQWYAFKNENMFTIVRNCTIESADQRNGECETAQSNNVIDTKEDTKERLIPNNNNNKSKPPPLKNSALEKPNHDDVVVLENSSDLIYKNGKGVSSKISQSEIYRHFVRFSYSTEIIRKAIEQARQSNELITNILRYLEGICENLSVQKICTLPKKQQKKECSVPDTRHLPKDPEGGLKLMKSFEEGLKRLEQGRIK